MSFHIVSTDSPQCSISCRDGQLVCKTAEGERKLPIEDVASIIITSFSAQIHSQLFLEAAKHGVALIICEAFKPVSLVLPANRSTDTLLTRSLLKIKEKTVARFWQATIDAKCRNQFLLAAHGVFYSLPRLWIQGKARSCVWRRAGHDAGGDVCAGVLVHLAAAGRGGNVAQASKPAVSRISKSAAAPARWTLCRLGRRRHSRLGSPRYGQAARAAGARQLSPS